MSTVEGLSEDEAKVLIQQAGYDYRVEERNGQPVETDDEHRTDRITMKVDDGTVVSARVG